MVVLAIERVSCVRQQTRFDKPSTMFPESDGVDCRLERAGKQEIAKEQIQVGLDPPI